VSARGDNPPGPPAALLTTLARTTFAASLAALGALLLLHDFAYVWVPLPRSLACADEVAFTAGLLLALGAVALLSTRTRAPSAALLAVFFLSWLAFLQVPRIVSSPEKEGLWSGAGQLLTVIAGAWTLYADRATRGPRWLRGPLGLRLARSVFALGLPALGIHHFHDPAGTAQAVPAWLPLRMELGYATGALHILAGAAILLGILPRLAATLEALMIASFVLLIHVPWTLDAPADPLQWTMLVVAANIGAAAWVVARSCPPRTTKPTPQGSAESARSSALSTPPETTTRGTPPASPGSASAPRTAARRAPRSPRHPPRDGRAGATSPR